MTVPEQVVATLAHEVDALAQVVADSRCSSELIGIRIRNSWAEIGPKLLHAANMWDAAQRPALPLVGVEREQRQQVVVEWGARCFDTWLIRKNGYFYRPKSRGYTASIYEAGLYSREDAEQEARIEPSITAHPISEYRQLAEVDLAQARRVIALIDGFASKPAGQPVEGWQRKLERAADAELFTQEELRSVNGLGDEVCDYIERCRTKLALDGGIRAGVDHHIRQKVLPMLAARAKELLAALSPAPASPQPREKS